MTRKTQIFSAILIVFTFFSFFLAIYQLLQEKELTFQKKISSFTDITDKGIAKLTLRGIIHDDDFEVEGINSNEVINWIKSIKNSKNILGVLIELDSPGGEVGPTKKIYKAIIDLKKSKPVVVYINSIAASGGYYIASACSKIFADDSAIIGSIGVIMLRPNIEKLLDRFGIQVRILKAGRFKDLSYPFRELVEEEEKMYQEILDTAYSNFISDVAMGRKQSEKLVIEQWAEGKIFSGKKAKSLQLIDEIGGEEEAIHSLKEILQITEDLPIYEPEESDFKKFLRLFNIYFKNNHNVFNIESSQLYYLFLNSSFVYNMNKFFYKD